MRSSRYYLTGITAWRVPNNGKWYIRDTTYSEPSSDYTANGFLVMGNLDVNGNVLSFNDIYGGYSTGTTVICSTNVKGFSYFD
jgi:hypothetical protein